MPTNKGSREGSEQDALYSSQSSDDSLPTHYTIGEETKQVRRDSIHQVRGTCWITDDYLSDSYRPDREPNKSSLPNVPLSPNHPSILHD